MTLTLSSIVPTHTGYTFQGWGTSASDTTPDYQPGGSYTANAAVTLYAIWKADTYTITFNADGGTGAPASQTATYGQRLTLSSQIPARTGFTFEGWGIHENATQAVYQPGEAYLFESDTTLYAVWRLIIYDVIYDANGGSGAPYNQTKPYGETVTLSSTIPTRSGYTFQGWGTSAGDTTPDYQPGGSYTSNASITLYAVWEEIPATLTKLEVLTKPAKTVYEIGEALDTTGLTLRATYSDGSTKTVSSGFTTSGFSSATAGTKTVTVSYQGLTASFTVTVNAAVPDEDAPQIVVSQEEVIAGESVDVEVSLKNNPGINTFTLTIEYDTSKLSLTGVTQSSNLGGNFYYAENTRTVVWQAMSDTDFNGLAMTLHFDTVEGAEGSAAVTVSYKAGNICNYDEEDVNFAVVPGSVTLLDYVPGDINGDGLVNNKDLNRLMKYLADPSTEVSEKALDVNGDGAVNNKDLNRLMKYLADSSVEIH